jgi:hypothetical protein
MKLRLVLSLVIFSFPGSVPAQNRPELFSKVDEVFAQKEPAWKVERTYPSYTIDPITEGITFRSGRNQAAIDIVIWRREKDARDVFVGESLALDNTLHGMVRSTLPELGDENHIWTHRGSTGWPTIKFRKGSIDVTVFAPSVTIAKRFALHILSQMTPVNTSEGSEGPPRLK